MNYKNPVISGFYPDPSICAVANDFYLVCSSFEFLPGIPLFHSTNLVDWEQIGHCIDRKGMVQMSHIRNSEGIFAPTIRYYEGTFYVTSTNITQGTFIISTEDIYGPWSDPVWIDTDTKGIDPSLTFIQGICYMQLSTRKNNKNEIIQFEINPKTGEILSEKKVISFGSGGRDAEAPHIYFKDGFYYLLLAEGGTREGHMVTVQRSRNIWGPFKSFEANPILTNRDQGDLLLQSIGHADLVEDQTGKWWLVALGTRPFKHRHLLGRETILMPVVWEKGEWPKIAQGFVTENVMVDNLPDKRHTKDDADFLKNDRMAWNYIRSFRNEYFNFSSNQIIIQSGTENLDDRSTCSFIGRRQDSYDFSFSASFSADLNSFFQETGLVLYKDSHHHIDFVETLRSEQRVLILRKRVADICEEIVSSPIDPDRPIHLAITGSKERYDFYYQINGDLEKIFLGSTETRHLTSEVADSQFTGVYLGLYATTNHDQNAFKALVTDVEYKN